MAEKSNLLVPASIVVAGLFIATAVILSNNGLIQIGQKPETAGTASGDETNTDPVSQTIKVSADDDPVLGNQDAPVTLIEFSDYECPYCGASAGTNADLISQFKSQDPNWKPAYPELLKNYIETGKVKYIFRDMPLPFHDPAATREAMAANCARDQGGDEAYYKYHDELFKLSKYNGQTPADVIDTAAGTIGLDIDAFKSCVSSEKFKDEINKDKEDFQRLSNEAVSKKMVDRGLGTPTYFIDKSTDFNEIDGTLISGSQSYAVFSSIIESMLSE